MTSSERSYVFLGRKYLSVVDPKLTGPPQAMGCDASCILACSVLAPSRGVSLPPQAVLLGQKLNLVLVAQRRVYPKYFSPSAFSSVINIS
jgi:hypothetical protein